MHIFTRSFLLRAFALAVALVGGIPLQAQRVVEHEQVSFPDSIIAGGYSGITWMGGDKYAVVSDCHEKDGFFVFRIALDEKGAITSAGVAGFRGNEDKGHDNEGIAWSSHTGSFWVSGERDNQVRELTPDGKATGRRLPLPEVLRGASSAYGLEALTYNAVTHRFWTTSESTLAGDGDRATAQNRVQNRLRLMAFGDDLTPKGTWCYEMDAPEVEFTPQRYAIGVSALTALDDGRLLVLEREFAVPESKIGATVVCKIFLVSPEPQYALAQNASIKGVKPLEKKLLAEWTTGIGLLDFSIANYEGMCLGPTLDDGGQVVVLIADSQSQYAGILADWLKTFVVYW